MFKNKSIIMKNLKFLTVSLFASLCIVSCSDDDDNQGGTDPEINRTATLYASSNTSGDITAYDFNDNGSSEVRTLLTLSSDGEGLYVDTSSNQITQASRSLLNLNTYANANVSPNDVLLDVVASSTVDLTSPRDIAVNGNLYVVSDNDDFSGNGNNRLFVYTRTGDSYTLRNTITVEFALWGIEFVGNDLYAVVDKTSDVAVFANFGSNTSTATVAPTKRVTIEGIVRTHGIGADGGTLILTDIGVASADDSPDFNTDGAFHVIPNFVSVFNNTENGGTVPVAGTQTRVAGNITFLGNPVSADFDAETNTVYIAERANGSGRILAFANVGEGGNLAPTINNSLNGASSVYFVKE